MAHCISVGSVWEQQGIFTFNRPWAALLQHNWWRKDGTVTFAFWISLHFYGWMSWLSHLFKAVFSIIILQGCFFFYPFFPFCGSKPYFLLANDLLSAAQRALMLFVLTTLFYSSEQSWLSKGLKYVPNFTYTKSESKVNGTRFGMCLSTFQHWVFLCIKNLLVWQHLSLKALIDHPNQSLSQIGE